MINNLSYIISKKLVDKYPEQMPSLNITKYSIKFLISNTLPIFITLLLGYIVGLGYETLIFTGSFVILRIFSGGVHLKSPELCFIVSIVFILSMTYIASLFHSLALLDYASLLLVGIYAPSNIIKQTRVKEEKFIYFKIISILVVLVSIVTDNNFMSLAIFTQSLLLIRSLKGGEKE